MDDETPGDDQAAAPVRVAEATVAAYQWDDWSSSAARASRRASRLSLVLAVVVGMAAAVAGIVLLPGANRLSVVVYAPLVAWGVRVWTRRLLARRGLAPVVEQVRALTVPRLVDELPKDVAVSLVRDGGALLTSRFIVLTVERRDSLVAVVATEHDPGVLPHNPFAERPQFSGP